MRKRVFLSPGDDCRHGQEIDPDPVPPVTVLLDNLVLVADPVLVPAIDSCRVVNAKNIDVFNLKSSGLDLVDDPSERTRGICTGEDVLVHEDTPTQLERSLTMRWSYVWKPVPDEILVLPVGTNASDLEDKDAIVVEKVIDLPEERLVPANSNVLGTTTVRSLGEESRVCIHLSHLETNDLREGTLLRRNFSVVHAENAGTTGITVVGPDPFVTELGLILAESNTSNFAVVVLVSESGKGTPSTSNVE